jgi:hypothetical protein
MTRKQQSRDCQKKAWKYHKAICKNRDDIRTQIDEQCGTNPSLTRELHARFETTLAVQKWVHRHRPVLSWALFNAYDLGRHPERGKTHVMIVQLKQTGNAKKIRNMFSIVDVYLLSREELAVSQPQYMEVMAEGDRGYALRPEGSKKDRVMSYMLFDYGFSAHWTGPMWDKEELAQRTTDPDWFNILKSLTDGKTEYEMVDGNAVRKDACSYFLFLHHCFN